MAAYHDIPVTLLRQLMDYDPRTGLMTWRERTPETNNGIGGGALRRINSRISGKAAFTSRHPGGYLSGAIFGRCVTAHRVAWALHYGEWPEGIIDHINGIPTDNRISNLRIVTNMENQHNRKMNKNNPSGCTGVTMPLKSNKWLAAITVNHKTINLGRFRHFDDAVAARKAAEKLYGYHVNHGRGGR